METAKLAPPPAVKPVLPPLMMGYIVMTVVLMIWSGFALSIRAIASSELTTADVALLRFWVPTLLLLPFIPSRIHRIRNTRLSGLPVILLGGLPFFIFAALGAQTIPTAYVGNILAGMQPLFVSILLYLVYRQVISKNKLMPLALILMGALIMILAQPTTISPEMLEGFLWLISGGIIWAAYTIGLQRSALDPISIGFIISFVAALITII